MSTRGSGVASISLAARALTLLFIQVQSEFLLQKVFKIKHESVNGRDNFLHIWRGLAKDRDWLVGST
jgi:hypothetical protein